MTQITANLMEKTLQLNCFTVTVFASDDLTKKRFGHYALLKIFSLRSPSSLSGYIIKEFIVQNDNQINDSTAPSNKSVTQTTEKP